MDSSLLSGLAGGLVAAFLLRYCLHRGRPSQLARADHEGWRHVAFGTAYRAMVLIAAICGLVLILAATHAIGDRSLAMLAVCSSFAVLAIYALYATFLRTVRFDGHSLQSLHPGMIREIALADIVEVRPFPGLGYARVLGRDGDSIWLPRVGGYWLLVRYVRGRARAAFLDKALARTRIDLPAAEADDVASLALLFSARHGRPVRHAGFSDLGQSGPWLAADRIKSSAVVVVLTHGSATLVGAGRYTWRMSRGDSVMIPRAAARGVTIAPRPGDAAKLALFEMTR